MLTKCEQLDSSIEDCPLKRCWRQESIIRLISGFIFSSNYVFLLKYFEKTNPFYKCTVLGEIPHYDSFPTFSRIYIYRTRMHAKIILFISNIFCGVVELICRKQQISSSVTKPLLFGQNSILRRHQRPQKVKDIDKCPKSVPLT